ncbi:MAG: 1-acyl-sn-glycerol-3-phosphate acyltransferase [Flavobacteriales bacterium]|nr:1-acyl-sn-glycerol-3-phosphate acyltransferase [Flavobacteriales bacterium]
MIRANHSAFWVKFSKLYTKILVGFFFRNVRFVGDYQENNKPILLLSNHFSFFDGFIQILLNDKVFKRQYNFMMLEKELKKNMILTKIGASSINKGHRSKVDSLKYAVEMLSDSKKLFLFFPEGRIKSLYTRNFVFEKGMLNYILENKGQEFELVFNVNLLEYGSQLRPEITAHYETFSLNSDTTSEDIESAFNTFANACIEKQNPR